MTKEELMWHIKAGMKTEESAIAIYARHLSAIANRCDLPDSKIPQIKESLEILIKANREHRDLLNMLLKRIQRESIDVY